MSPRVVEICAAEEQFDGNGGAVATWVKEVGLRSKYTPTIACPSPSRDYAEGLPLASGVWNRLAVGYVAAARAVVGRTGRNPAGGAKRLTGHGRLWLAAQVPFVRSADLVHVHNRPNYCRWLRKLGYQGSIVCHMHNELSEKSPSREEIDAVDAWIFCSNFIRLRAIELYDIDPAICFTVHNGVADVKTRIEDKAPRENALFVGRLVEQKGVVEAVRMWHEVVREGHSTDLLIVGSGGSGGDAFETPYTRELEQLVAELSPAGQSNVRLLGARTHSEVLDLMQEADVFLLPCQEMEAFGLVIVEAMSRGALPVVTRIGGIPEVLPADWPFIVDVHETVDAGARAWASILDLPSEEKALMANQVSARSHDFLWDELADTYDSVISAVFARSELSI